MTTILKSIHKWENRFDRSAEQFALNHPYLAFFTMFIGMPVFILAAVSICTMLLVWPFAAIFGWM